MDDRLLRDLKAIDARLQRVPLRRELERRVLDAEPRVSPVGWLIVGTAAAAVLIAFFVGRWTVPVTDAPAQERIATRNPAAVPTEVDPHDVPPTQDTRCPDTLGDEVTLLAPGCRLAMTSPVMTIDAHEPTLLTRTARGVMLHRGDALFVVEKIAAGGLPVQVQLRAGTIEVIGTRFAVHERADEGHVDLLEGMIAFSALDGVAHAVVPGRRLAWAGLSVVAMFEAPVAETPTPTHASPRHAEDSSTSKPTPERSRESLDETLDEVAALRRAGDYRGAVDLLVRVRARGGNAKRVEILSYEEGTLRERYQTTMAVCAFWRAHAKRFDGGVYLDAVAARSERLGCDTP